jgi:hypothetical protein
MVGAEHKDLPGVEDGLESLYRRCRDGPEDELGSAESGTGTSQHMNEGHEAQKSRAETAGRAMSSLHPPRLVPQERPRFPKSLTTKYLALLMDRCAFRWLEQS